MPVRSKDIYFNPVELGACAGEKGRQRPAPDRGCVPLHVLLKHAATFIAKMLDNPEGLHKPGGVAG